MKKKLLSLTLAVLVALPCMASLTACKKECSNHYFTLNSEEEPTIIESGLIRCPECMEEVELPALNKTDYEVDDSNPDHVLYFYKINGQSFRFDDSKFHCSPAGFLGLENGFIILEYFGNSENVVVPETVSRWVGTNYEEFPVIAITDSIEGQDGFNNNTTIKSIVLPSTIVKIHGGFAGCTNLKSIYYKGDKANWDNVTITNKRELSNATVYCYSENEPSIEDYLESDCKVNAWHYDKNNKVEKWFNLTSNVDGKSFNYSHSEVAFSDAYWAALKEAETQGTLGDLFENDQVQIEMVTSSQNKAEYESKFATWYGTIYTSQTTISFAENKITLTLSGFSSFIDYIEINSEVYNSSNKDKLFSFDSATNVLFDAKVDEFSSIKHVYTIVEA